MATSHAVSKLRFSEFGGRQILRCLRHSLAIALSHLRGTQSNHCEILQ